MASSSVCPYCRRRPEVPEHRPFCCARCRMADLGRWLAGDYRVPGSPADGTDDDDAEEASDRAT